MPGASELHLAGVCDDIIEQLALVSEGYPNIALTGSLTTTVTRHRPMPLPDLRRSLSELGGGAGRGPHHAGTTSVGDLITRCGVRAAASPR